MIIFFLVVATKVELKGKVKIKNKPLVMYNEERLQSLSNQIFWFSNRSLYAFPLTAVFKCNP